MARLAIGLACFGLGIVAGAAIGAHAQDDDTAALAAQAGVDPTALAAAVATVQAAGIDTDARRYLEAEGLIEPERASSPQARAVVAGGGVPTSTAPGWPIGGWLGQRIYCIEGIESRHGRGMYNPTPVRDGEHAQGWLGFLPSTARSVGVTVGNRASEWQGAAYMLTHGRGREFTGVAMGLC